MDVRLRVRGRAEVGNLVAVRLVDVRVRARVRVRVRVRGRGRVKVGELVATRLRCSRQSPYPPGCPWRAWRTPAAAPARSARPAARRTAHSPPAAAMVAPVACRSRHGRPAVTGGLFCAPCRSPCLPPAAVQEAATVEGASGAVAERRPWLPRRLAAHLLDEPAPLVGAVSEASVVVSPGSLLRVKARRLLLRLGLAHRTRCPLLGQCWVGTTASCQRDATRQRAAQDAEGGKPANRGQL